MFLLSSNYAVIDAAILSPAINYNLDSKAQRCNCFAGPLLAGLCVPVICVLGLCCPWLLGSVAARRDIAKCFHDHSCFGKSLLTPLLIAMIRRGCSDEAWGWRDLELVDELLQPSWRTRQHRFRCWNEFTCSSCCNQSICAGQIQLFDRLWLMYDLVMSTDESCEH